MEVVVAPVAEFKMPPVKVIYQEMLWLFITCLFSTGLFVVQAQNLNDSVIDNMSDIKRNLQNASFSIKAAVNEHSSKLTPQGNVIKHQPSDSKSNTISTTPSTEPDEDKPFLSFPRSLSTGAMLRGFYVLVGLGAIVVIYIVVRTIRLRRKRKTVRKYGILANREDVEMTPLGAEDEEEESTLFDMMAHNAHS